MPFAKQTIRDADLKGKTVLLRADYNVPQDEQGAISNDYRIRQSLPTLHYLLDHGVKQICIMSHLGRPEGKASDTRFSLQRVAEALSGLIDQPVEFVPDCKQTPAWTHQIALRENLRFCPDEEANSDAFAAQLAQGFDLFVQDGFGVVHRAHASTDAITRHLPSVAGLLLEKEVRAITDAVENPTQPFVAILGGAKIADKIDLIEHLMERGVKQFLIGGAMANTFFVAKGLSVGASTYDKDDLEEAKRISSRAKEKGVDLVLPEKDVAVGETVDASAERREMELDQVGPQDRILDIGPKSLQRFVDYIRSAGTVIWNGPLGLTELPAFAEGSRRLAEALAESSATSIIGGGDTAGFIDQIGMSERFTHVSTGGGASLELMSGKKLPGLEALLDKP